MHSTCEGEDVSFEQMLRGGQLMLMSSRPFFACFCRYNTLVGEKVCPHMILACVTFCVLVPVGDARQISTPLLCRASR